MSVIAGKPVTLLADTAIATTTVATASTVTGDWVTGLGQCRTGTILLTYSGVSCIGSTVSAWIQTSPNQGTTVDDIAAFAQVVPNQAATGSRILVLSSVAASASIDRATRDGTLTAGTALNIDFCDRVRIKIVATGNTSTGTYGCVGFFK